MNPTTFVLAAFLAAVAAGLFFRFSAARVAATSKESFMQQPVGAPLNGPGIGPYDQVNMGGGASGWASTEGAKTGDGSAPLPSQSDDSNKLMYLVGNQVDADCCPSVFNTDTGCVCLTAQNRAQMASRGGNRA
jgi:hypothetical protein